MPSSLDCMDKGFPNVDEGPRLGGGFRLVTCEESISWREVLPRHMLAKMQEHNSKYLTEKDFKVYIQPFLATIRELLREDPEADLVAIERYFLQDYLAHRSDYASQ